MSGIFSTEHVNATMNKDVAAPVPVTTQEQLNKAIPTRDALRYVKNDTYIADVSAILGLVYYEKTGSDKLIPFYVSVGASVDPRSKLTAPQIVSELIVDSKMKAKGEALSLISADVSAEELLEVRVVNNSSARIVQHGEEWEAAISKWMNNPLCQALVKNPSVGTISVVTGAVQKYFTTKKYKKFEAGAKGGGWGVNVEGSLYTSTSQFELSVVYGLDLVTFKQADDMNEFAENLANRSILDDPVKLAQVNKKFDLMALSRPSIFRITDEPAF